MNETGDSTANGSGTVRPILTGGEQLRLDVGPVRSGGGDKFHPVTPSQAAQLLRPQVESLRISIEALPDELIGANCYFQMTLLPNYLAASYFPSQLLSAAGLVAVGSRPSAEIYTTSQRSESTTSKSLIVTGLPDSIARLEGLVTSSGDGSRSRKAAFEQLREVSEIRLPNVSEIVGSTQRKTEVWEAVLHPRGIDQRGDFLALADGTFEKWAAWVDSLDGEVVAAYRRSEAGLTFVPVRLDPDVAEEASRFNPLRSLRPMPALRPIPRSLLRGQPPRVMPSSNPNPIGQHVIAVFDGGLQDDTELQAVQQSHLTCEAEDEEGLRHGTAVTAAAVVGMAEPGLHLKRPSSAAHHFRVWPCPDSESDFYAYWVLDQIEEVLRYEHFPIVCLSLGPDVCVEDADEPNRWTSTLDRIAYEDDVLFVAAAGNNGMADHATGLDRVQVPADMANGISVGACNAAHGADWSRVAYSAIGPGRTGSRVQPHGVQFGGDLSAGRPFFGVQRDGHLWETEGTSFACPLVVDSLSRLGARLDTVWRSANSLRAFATHFAECHTTDESQVETGHGRLLLDYEPVLECEPNEVHLLYQDRLNRHDLLSLALPIPETVESGRVAIRITLAFASPVEPTQPLEYTQATIVPVFRPHANKFRLTRESSSRIVDIASEQEEARGLLAAGYQLGGHPASRSLPGTVGPETELREGGKWETVRRFDMSMMASSLWYPRLDLSYLARRAGVFEGSAAPLDFTMLVTARASKTISLYSDVEAQFPVLSRLTIDGSARVDALASS